MPLTDEQIQALRSADKDDLVAALHEHVPAAYQAVFNKGHSEATKKAKADGATITQQLEEARAEITARDERIKEMEAKAPEAATLRQQYEQREREMREKHKAEIADRDRRFRDKEVERIRAEFRASLTGYDPDWADVQVDKHMRRVRVRDDGGHDVLQDGADIPLTAPEGKSALSLLAAEIKEKAPAWAVLSNADRGGNVRGGEGGGGATNTFDRIRAEVRQQQEKQQQQESKPLAARLGQTAA